MLSGCIMIGRAPKELIDLIGYNPVIEVEWHRAQQQLYDILDSVDKYQNLVNHNYEIAKRYASWGERISQIVQVIEG